MVIVDSTVWVDYFNGLHNLETDWLDVQRDVQRLGLTTIIMCEVLHGVRDERQAVVVETEFSKLDVFTMDSVTLAVEAAKNYRMLRERGRTVRKTIDVLFATFCIEEQHSLLHRDRDFVPSRNSWVYPWFTRR